MKFTYKVLYALSLIVALIGVAMFIWDSEGAAVPILIGVALAIGTTYGHLTDREGR